MGFLPANFALHVPFRSRVRSRHATDRQTDGSTDKHRDHFIMPLPYVGGGIIMEWIVSSKPWSGCRIFLMDRTRQLYLVARWQRVFVVDEFKDDVVVVGVTDGLTHDALLYIRRSRFASHFLTDRQTDRHKPGFHSNAIACVAWMRALRKRKQQYFHATNASAS